MLKPLPHTYTAQLDGGREGYATISEERLPDLVVAPPADFGGPGDAWSPEHLLLASVQACYLFTLRAVARHISQPFDDLRVTATGLLDRQDGTLRFTDIVLRVQITVPAGSEPTRVRHLLDTAKKGCLISASLSTPVRVDAEIVETPIDLPIRAVA
jgi:peroxiredoxin-like protein